MRLAEVLLLILAFLYVLTFGLLSKNLHHFDSHSVQSQSPDSLSKPAADNYELANRQSFGFFYDISEENWKRLRQIYNEHVNHLHPEKPFVYHPQAQEHQSIPEVFMNRRGHPGWSSYAAWYQSNYEPNFSCQFERRIGGETGNGDGPKWVCDPHRIRKLAKERKAKDPSHPGCVVYSVGSNGDFSFELGMQKEIGEGICEFHIFDMGDYENAKPPELKNSYYHRWGFKGQDGNSPSRMGSKKSIDIDKFLSLQDTIKQLGHDKLDVIDVFKIDCEKCEWDTYQDWIADDVPMLHQILVEVHEAPIDKALNFFNLIENAGYLRFHKEPNIQWDTSCIEYAFVKVHKSFMEGKK